MSDVCDIFVLINVNDFDSGNFTIRMFTDEKWVRASNGTDELKVNVPNQTPIRFRAGTVQMDTGSQHHRFDAIITSYSAYQNRPVNVENLEDHLKNWAMDNSSLERPAYTADGPLGYQQTAPVQMIAGSVDPYLSTDAQLKLGDTAPHEVQYSLGVTIFRGNERKTVSWDPFVYIT